MEPGTQAESAPADLRRHARALAEKVERLVNEELAALEESFGRREQELADRERQLAGREAALRSEEERQRSSADELKAQHDVLVAQQQDFARERQSLSERREKLAEIEERLRSAEAGFADRERELEQREKAVAAREFLASRITPLPAVAAEPEDAAAGYHIDQLEGLVAEHGREHPERLQEWEAYLFQLRTLAGSDGSLPDTLTGLVEDVFAPILA